jgi:hypothetical protein
MIELFRVGFLQVTLVDVLDVAAVGALFYWLYRALSDTPACRCCWGWHSCCF